MYDLKARFLHGKAFHVLTGPVLIPIVLGIAAITAAAFYLNAVFAFAIIEPGRPQVRSAFRMVKMSAKLVSGRKPADAGTPSRETPDPAHN